MPTPLLLFRNPYEHDKDITILIVTTLKIHAFRLARNIPDPKQQTSTHEYTHLYLTTYYRIGILQPHTTAYRFH